MDFNGQPYTWNPYLYVFKLFYPSSYIENQILIPTFTQAPLCNYNLQYELKYASNGVNYNSINPSGPDKVDFLSLELNTGEGHYKAGGTVNETPEFRPDSVPYDNAVSKIYFGSGEKTRDKCVYG